MKILIFASGRGSNFEALVKASKKGELLADIVGLCCDRDCNAVNIAKDNGIPVSRIDPKDAESIIKTVKQYDPSYILLAGYMRIIAPELIDEYPMRIINIHPSLLPMFKGKDAIKQAWDAGVKETGVTVHFVNDKMDAGVIIMQEKISIPSSIEALESSIHELEHRIYVKAVNSIVKELKTLLISRCLLGDNVRYDGGNKHSKRAVKIARDFNGTVLKVCPELDAGLGVPRDSLDLISNKVVSKNGEDVTELMVRTCDNIVSKLGEGMILVLTKEKSPSCGKYDPMGVLTSLIVNRLGSRVIIVNEEEI